MLIVSLTSTRKRLMLLKYCWASLSRQALVPDQILLQLAEPEFPEGEDYVKELLAPFGPVDRLSINFVEDLRSYKKLLPVISSARDDDFVITVDDDVLYHPAFTQRMAAAGENHPEQIVSGCARRIRKNPLGRFYNYYRWPLLAEVSSGHDLLPVGAGGVGYRKALLDLEFLTDKTCMSVAPTADDLWFKLAASRLGTGVFHDPHLFADSVPLQHRFGLQEVNNADSGVSTVFFSRFLRTLRRECMDGLGVNRTPNDSQWDAALEYSGRTVATLKF